MSRSRQALGKWGEAQAASYLEGLGYQIVGKNIRTPFGELDLIALQGQDAVFVEVKTRTGNTFGWPEEAVTQRKQASLRAAAEAYLLSHPDMQRAWRIDVIAVERRPEGEKPSITHFVDAVF